MHTRSVMVAKATIHGALPRTRGLMLGIGVAQGERNVDGGPEAAMTRLGPSRACNDAESRMAMSWKEQA